MVRTLIENGVLIRQRPPPPPEEEDHPYNRRDPYCESSGNAQQYPPGSVRPAFTDVPLREDSIPLRGNDGPLNRRVMESQLPAQFDYARPRSCVCEVRKSLCVTPKTTLHLEQPKFFKIPDADTSSDEDPARAKNYD